MERIRDGELQTDKGAVKDGVECVEDKGREGLIERRGGDGGRGGRKHCEHTESNSRSSTWKCTNVKELVENNLLTLPRAWQRRRLRGLSIYLMTLCLLMDQPIWRSCWAVVSCFTSKVFFSLSAHLLKFQFDLIYLKRQASILQPAWLKIPHISICKIQYSSLSSVVRPATYV